MPARGSSKPPEGFGQLLGMVPGAGSGGRGKPGGEEVYLGELFKTGNNQGRRMAAELGGSAGKPKKGATYGTVDSVSKQFFTWSDKKRQDFLAQGVLTGLLQEGAGVMEASSLWGNMVKEAARYAAAGAKVTPWDIMSSYVKQAGGANAWVRQGDFEVNRVTGERRYVGPQFKTTTDSRVDLTDPRTAAAITTQIFQQMMGRNPGKGELGAFAKALAKAEKANPVRSTTTTEFDLTTGEPVHQDTTQSGGLTAEARAMIGQNQVKDDKEYGAFQAATTYKDAFDQAVYGAPE